jgi:hypothetical protein
MTSGRMTNGPGYLPHQPVTDEQVELDEVNRHRMIRVVLRNASDADDLVLLTAALELDEELDELATTPKRQRLIAAARERLAATVGSPADL